MTVAPDPDAEVSSQLSVPSDTVTVPLGVLLPDARVTLTPTAYAWPIVDGSGVSEVIEVVLFTFADETTIVPFELVSVSLTLPLQIAVVLLQRVAVTVNVSEPTGVEPVVLTVKVTACATPSPATTIHCDEARAAPVGRLAVAVIDTARPVEPLLFVTFAVKVAVLPWITGFGDWPEMVTPERDAKTVPAGMPREIIAKSEKVMRTTEVLLKSLETTRCARGIAICIIRWVMS